MASSSLAAVQDHSVCWIPEDVEQTGEFTALSQLLRLAYKVNYPLSHNSLNEYTILVDFFLLLFGHWKFLKYIHCCDHGGLDHCLEKLSSKGDRGKMVTRQESGKKKRRKMERKGKEKGKEERKSFLQIKIYTKIIPRNSC